jgi:hypothetical protein
MSWTVLDPVVKFAPRVKASIHKPKAKSSPYLWIMFTDFFLKEFPYHNHANVMSGAGELVGHIRVEFDPKGKFETKPFEKGGARLVLPMFQGLPQAAKKATACEIVKKDSTSVVFRLPLNDWEAPPPRALQPAIPTKGGQNTGPSQVVERPPASMNGNGSKLIVDAALYLRGKGLKCQRLAGDWYQVDGVKTPKVEVLRMVNKYRTAQELPSLSIEQVN